MMQYSKGWRGEYRTVVINPIQPITRSGYTEIKFGTEEYSKAITAINMAYCDTMAGRRFAG